jgi:hypothetical protein
MRYDAEKQRELQSLVSEVGIEKAEAGTNLDSIPYLVWFPGWPAYCSGDPGGLESKAII